MFGYPTNQQGNQPTQQQQQQQGNAQNFPFNLSNLPPISGLSEGQIQEMFLQLQRQQQNQNQS